MFNYGITFKEIKSSDFDEEEPNNKTIKCVENDYNKYIYKINIAGTEKEDISIKLFNNNIFISIKGELKKEYTLKINDIVDNNDIIDLENISSEYKNGILNIYFYKKEKNTKTIEIK